MTKTWNELWEEFKITGAWHKEFYTWVSKKYPNVNIVENKNKVKKGLSKEEIKRIDDMLNEPGTHIRIR